MVKAGDFAGASALKTEMEKAAGAQITSLRDNAAARDRHICEQKEQLQALVTDGDNAGAAALKAEMEKEAEAQVAVARDVAAA